MKRAPEKNANDIEEIISAQLDILTSDDVTPEEVKAADAVANQIGKSLKHAALRIGYKEYRKQGGEIIEALEPRK